MTAYRLWTTTERKTATRMRAADATDAEIGQALGRSKNAISMYLRKHGLSGAECRRQRRQERDTILRRAYPRWVAGESIPALMREFGWTSSRQAMWQALRAYRKRIGPDVS